MFQRIVINLDSRALHILNSGAPEPRGSGGNCPRCPNIAGATRGQQIALFARTAPRNLIYY